MRGETRIITITTPLSQRKEQVQILHQKLVSTPGFEPTRVSCNQLLRGSTCRKHMHRTHPNRPRGRPTLLRSPDSASSHAQQHKTAAGAGPQHANWATGKRVPTGTRTRNLLLRRQAPYPLGHRDQPLGSKPFLPTCPLVSLHKKHTKTH
jgi:hypothetical protein